MKSFGTLGNSRLGTWGYRVAGRMVSMSTRVYRAYGRGLGISGFNDWALLDS